MTEQELKTEYKAYLRQKNRDFSNNPVGIIMTIILIVVGYFLVNNFGWIIGLFSTIILWLILLVFTWMPYKAFKVLSFEKWAKEYLERQELIRKQNRI